MVSVILPNYNHSAYLKQRIDSILSQTYQDFELIILDDKSSDSSADIINAYRDNPHVSHIKINQENSGSPFLQWQRGFILASGEYIWIAESDDYADPAFLERCVDELNKHPNCVFCHTDSFFVDSLNNPAGIWIEKLRDNGNDNVYYNGIDFVCNKMIESNSVYNASMVVFRKSALDYISDSYTDYLCCGDWVFWGEMALSGDVIKITDKLNYFRQHESKVSSQSIGNRNNLREAVRAKIHIHNMTPMPKDTNLFAIGSIYKSIRKTRFFDIDFYHKYSRKFLKSYPYAPIAAVYYKNMLKRKGADAS